MNKNNNSISENCSGRLRFDEDLRNNRRDSTSHVGSLSPIIDAYGDGGSAARTPLSGSEALSYTERVKPSTWSAQRDRQSDENSEVPPLETSPVGSTSWQSEAGYKFRGLDKTPTPKGKERSQNTNYTDGWAMPVVLEDDDNESNSLDERDIPTTQISQERLNHTTQSESSQMTEEDLIEETQVSEDEDLDERVDEIAREIYEKQSRKPKLRVKEGAKIALLNMRGRLLAHSRQCKFKPVSQFMRTHKIAVLALQETHLNEDEARRKTNEIPYVQILSNGVNTLKEGTALMLNRDLVQADKCESETLIEGRAQWAKIIMKSEQELEIVNLYADNSSTDKKLEFYRELKRQISANKHKWNKPIVMGDFNMCEDEIDRHPQTLNGEIEDIRETWLEIKRELELCDAWRSQNPHEIDFTFYQNNNRGNTVASRIDRIYTHKEEYKSVISWQSYPPLWSDHKMITCEIIAHGAPQVGKGMWRIQDSIMKEQKFIEATIEKVKILNGRMKKYKQKERTLGKLPLEVQKARLQKARLQANPQLFWTIFKNDIQEVAQKVEREKRTAVEKGRKQLKGRIQDCFKDLKRSRSDQEANDIKRDIIVLNEELANIERLTLHRLSLATQANWQAKGETNSKYWYNLRKPKGHNNLIKAIKDESGTLKYSPTEMVEIAEGHHGALESAQPLTKERLAAMAEILDKVDTKLPEKDWEETAKPIEAESLRKSLKKCQNGKSPGADGLTYEFWKWLTKLLDKLGVEEKDTPDIMKLMEQYLRDIEIWGPIDDRFAQGVMSLLYKKGDTTQVANYRPITLLNTDYKVYTRTIAETLAKVCDGIIHHDQAGFMPNRSIYDHTRLVNVMIEACEIEGVDGYIVALDQEKAYDRIDHKYLWAVMRKYGFHEVFIRRIRNIYENARTRVMINRTLGGGFNVERGVRQGDPMSCLLYNLAIEPLANLLRKSELQGIKLTEAQRKILAIIYADDTCLALDKTDKYSIVQDALDTFCKASTAKFNTTKTEVMAIGKEQFRKNFQTTRTMVDGTKFNNDIRVVKEGETMRMLGAWHGCKGAAEPQWNAILEKSERIISDWAKTRPTMRGRIMISKSLISSRFLYLAMVNGMPQKVEEKLDRMIRTFIWQGRGTMTWDSVRAPKELGGLAAPCAIARRKAVEIMWLKRLCAPEGQAPLWALIGRDLMRTHADHVKTNSIQCWLLQNLEIVQYKLPKSLIRLIQTAKEVNLGISPALPDKELTLSMPAYFHPALKKSMYRYGRCLMRNHGVVSVSDLWGFAQIPQPKDQGQVRGCEDIRKCIDKARRIIKAFGEKWHPDRTEQADGLDHTPRRLRTYRAADHRETEIAFNPDIRSSKDPYEELRIYRKGMTQKHGMRAKKVGEFGRGSFRQALILETPRKRPALRSAPPEGANWASPRTNRENRTDPIIVYTDGSSIHNGAQNAKVGAGIWYGHNDTRNKSIRVELPCPTNQMGELIAILVALRDNRTKEITIKSDSETSILGILKHSREWEDVNWEGVANADLIKPIIAELRSRPKEAYFRWVKAHDGEEGNEGADKLASEGINSDIEFAERDLEYDISMLEDGAKLSKITMKLAYEVALKAMIKPAWHAVSRFRWIDEILDQCQMKSGIRPTKELYLKSTWKLPVTNVVRDFIWRLQLDLFKCGDYFKRMGGDWAELSDCEQCETIESTTHILFDCPLNGNKETWKEVSKLWALASTSPWEEPDIRMITCLGVNVTLRGEEAKFDIADEKRTQILVSMAAWTIWKARCLRRIGGKEWTARNTTELFHQELKRFAQNEWSVATRSEKNRSKRETQFKDIWCSNQGIVEVGEKSENFKWKASL